jgi:hypothetical protein
MAPRSHFDSKVLAEPHRTAAVTVVDVILQR